MKTIYLDLASGISGDMFLGALIDLGADQHALERNLARLPLDGYHLHVGRQQRGAIEGVKFDVHLETEHSHTADSEAGGHSHNHPHAHVHREPRSSEREFAQTNGVEEQSRLTSAATGKKSGTGQAASEHSPHESHEGEHGHRHARTFADIRQMIQDSPFTHWVKHKSIAVFRRIAEAEGKVHGQPPEQVHFHEVGAVDSIVDIVGACLTLEQMGQPRVLASPVTEGTGWIDCAHGRLPIPAPATLEILSARGIPLSQCDEPNELVTPTGAALLAELAESFGPLRDFVPARIGYGLGSRETRTRNNVLRVVLGEPVVPSGDWKQILSHGHFDWETDVIVTLQTNLDDVHAEILGRFIEVALTQGALDAFFTPIQMKKNRPATLLTVLCAEADADKLTDLMLRETTAFGVRRFLTERRKLRREVVGVATPYGEVSVKLGRLNGQVIQATPEFESCKQVADRAHVPLRQVYDVALRGVKWT